MHFWLYRKFIWQKKVFFEPTTLFSIAGISLGVAFLLVSMAGFSGFTRSLKKSIIDVSGDINVFRRGNRISDPEVVKKEILGVSSDIVDISGFVQIDALSAHAGKLNAVILQGLDWSVVSEAPEIRQRAVGELSQEQAVDIIGAKPSYVGKVVAQKLKLELGDVYKVIMPQVSKSSATRVEPKVDSFYVDKILDFGKYEFNQRVIVVDLKAAQTLKGMGSKINGFRLRLKDSDKAEELAEKVQDQLGFDYSVRDWTMSNRSLFQAVEYEKMVLFFVMLVMVVAAFFNVSTTLFLGVLRRYTQISVMRALGLKKRDVVMLFCAHGLALGCVGLGIGLVLGLFFCWSFEKIQQIYPIMPEDVYRLSAFSAHIQWNDVFWVIVATLVICFISTLAPAIRGSRLSPVEGLKYE